jgi:hypothetical protein
MNRIYLNKLAIAWPAPTEYVSLGKVSTRGKISRRVLILDTEDGKFRITISAEKAKDLEITGLGDRLPEE